MLSGNMPTDSIPYCSQDSIYGMLLASTQADLMDIMALEIETKTYDKLASTTLSGQQGKFAAIFGDELIGVFETYSDALDAGYGKAGLKPFLVKQIAPFPVVANFTRDVAPCTQPA